ncbi:mycothiol synthase [Nocardioides jiangxiensis]|uniref:Mycothiol acetyltransferase n=1 Tax=Nocardioides jiangxiensis TaxID=3064524 RepID=A0ABT9AZ51_9ACTN|nr:mycothiol synthase [Nocardioides sp. WY-20]MDO7867867.1 mycothiol synthase [Nocardioides sp. WY-20]
MRVTTYDDTAAAAVARIARACHEADGRDPLDEAARLHLAHHGLRASALWLSADGFALARSVTGHVELDLAVAPGGRRTGEGTALLAAALAEVGAREVRAWSHGDHPGAAALAAATGFRRDRELLVLARPLPVEDGREQDLRIRAWQPGDAPELLRVNAAAFAHHPEQGGMDATNLAERMAEPWFDPAGLLVAMDGERMLGFHWTKVHGHAGDGEVYVVAVDPPAHARGVGGALLRAGLRHLAAAGARRVFLYVEADNAPALALYRGLGFSTDHAHVQYVRP